MMAAIRHFVYRGIDQDVIPRDATHVTIDESITVIPPFLFDGHRNIVELFCHEAVIKIEEKAFSDCPCLERVILLGVKHIERKVFCDCNALTYVECPRLERIGEFAFYWCDSLISIDLRSVKVVKDSAFSGCGRLKHVQFGKNLELIGTEAFRRCDYLKRITIPLKKDLFEYDQYGYEDETFFYCAYFEHVDLVEEEVLNETSTALMLQKWTNDMKEEIGSIHQILCDAPDGDIDVVTAEVSEHEEITCAIREWIGRVLDKIIHYKRQHRRILSEAATTLDELALPRDIVMKSVLPFLQLPRHKFDGEEEEEDDENDFYCQDDEEHCCKRRKIE